MKWVSVKDRLPDSEERVLTITVYKQNRKDVPQIFYYLNNYSFVLKRWEYPEDQCYEKITHWQPLPEPPKP